MTQSPATFLHSKSFHCFSDALIRYLWILLTEFLPHLLVLTNADTSLKILSPCNFLESMSFCLFGLIYSWTPGPEVSSALSLFFKVTSKQVTLCFYVKIPFLEKFSWYLHILFSTLPHFCHFLASWLLAQMPIHLACNLIHAHGFNSHLKLVSPKAIYSAQIFLLSSISNCLLGIVLWWCLNIPNSTCGKVKKQKPGSLLWFLPSFAPPLSSIVLISLTSFLLFPYYYLFQVSHFLKPELWKQSPNYSFQPKPFSIILQAAA